MLTHVLADYDALREISHQPFRSICYAPFVSLVFDSIGRVRVCCANFEHTLGDIREQRLDDIWNGAPIEEIRTALRDYRMHLGCEHCYAKLENGSYRSGSIRDSGMIAYKFDPFTAEEGPPYWPKHFEFHLTNRCNLECVMCTGEFSSSIRRNREQLPALSSAYGDEFFQDLQKYLPRLEMAQFLGGEPFLMPEMYRIWEMLAALPNPPRCHITTNGTVFGPKVRQVLETLPVSLAFSMDGATAETFEKIRVNARLSRFVSHFRQMRDIVAPRNGEVIINFALSRLNWHEMVDVALFAAREGARLQIIDVRWPTEFSLFAMLAGELEEILPTLSEQLEKVGSQLGPLDPLVRNKVAELISYYHEAPIRPPTLVVLEPEPELEPVFESDEWSLATRLCQTRNAKTIEGAIAELQEWNPAGAIDRLDFDEFERLTDIQADRSSPFSSASDALGQKADFLFELLQNRFGTHSLEMDLNDDLSDYSRVLRFLPNQGPPIELKCIFVGVLASNPAKDRLTMLVNWKNPEIR